MKPTVYREGLSKIGRNECLGKDLKLLGESPSVLGSPIINPVAVRNGMLCISTVILAKPRTSADFFFLSRDFRLSSARSPPPNCTSPRGCLSSGSSFQLWNVQKTQDHGVLAVSSEDSAESSQVRICWCWTSTPLSFCLETAGTPLLEF